MKRKYDQMNVKESFKRPFPKGSFKDVRPLKHYKKNPFIRLIAMFKGYLARKAQFYKIYQFYQ